MGLKYERTDDLDKLFENFAIDPDKLDTDEVTALLPKEDKAVTEKEQAEKVEKERKEKKIIK
jgi:hypothetical protein